MKRELVLSGMAVVLAGAVWAAEPIHERLVTAAGPVASSPAAATGVAPVAAAMVATPTEPAVPVFRPSSTPLKIQPYDRVLGRSSAPITIIEYASFTCSHCRDMHLQTLPRVQKDWIATGKAKFVFRDMPWDNLALGMAVTARCAPAKSYYPMVTALFEQLVPIYESKDKIGAIAGVVSRAGMTRAKVEECIRNENYQKLSNGMKVEAQSRLSVQGTPTIFVNGERIDGFVTYDELNKLLIKAYNKVAKH